MKPPARRPRRQAEASLTDAIRSAINALPDVRVWRNNCGVATHGPRFVRYGLGVGSPDLVGILGGAFGGVFLAIEVKRPKQRRSPAQLVWARMISDLGGIYLLATSVQQALCALATLGCVPTRSGP